MASDLGRIKAFHNSLLIANHSINQNITLWKIIPLCVSSSMQNISNISIGAEEQGLYSHTMSIGFGGMQDQPFLTSRV